MARDDNPFFDLADYSAGPPRDAMYSGFVPGTNPMARKAEQQRLMREAKQLTPAAALMRGLGEGYFGDVTTPNAEQGYSVMDPSNRAPAGREAEMQRYRDIGTALGIGADPITMLAPLAKPAAKAVKRGALAAARSDTAYDLANRVASATGASPLYAVKPKGGNWAPPINLDLPSKRLAGSESNANSDSVTRALSPLRTYYQGPNRAPAEIESLNANVADPLNRWLDKKLAPYVRNEMGTPDDPIRLAHEQGYSHSPAIRSLEENLAGAWLPQRTADARSAAGFPEEGFAVRRHAEAGYPEGNLLNTRRAEEWEIMSDRAIDPNIAENYQEDIKLGRQRLENRKPEFKSILGDWDPNVEMAENSPWIEKIDPSTPIYRIADSQTFSSDLDFNHLIDELRASLSPNSELPAHLRLTPETLNKVSVADAVKRVSEINDWRALEAAKAEQAGMLENLNSNARLADPTAKLSFVEKPGLTWVDIPEVVNKKGTKLCTDIGKAGGWCTMNADTAQEYGSGYNRLVALLDAEGRPHAQAMITESSTSPYILWYEQNPHRSPENNAFMDWVEQRARAGGSKKSSDQLYLEWAKETGRQIPHQESFDIQELKPPGNAFNSDRSEVYKKRDPEYQKKVSESVVKFLNSGEWGTVNDLDIYNIVDLQRDPHALSAYLRDITGKNNQASEAIFDAAMAANPDAPRFMIREQFKEFLKPFIDQPEIVYHAGAEFNEPRPGLFTHPEREVVEKFQSSTNAPQLHTFEARPRSSGTEEDVYRVARQLGIYDPEIPVGQYLEQGENAIFPQSAQVVEELRNLGFDSLRLQDAMSKKPSLVALDPSVLRRVPPAEGYAEGGAVKSDFFLDPSSYAQSRSKQMFPKQKSEWTQQDAARHMLASGMMAQKFGPTVAKIAGLAHEHGNAPVKTIGYMLGIGKMPPDYDQDLHNNALGVQLAKDAASQEDLESRIQAILNSATKQPTPGQPWIGRPNIPAQMSDYAKGGRVSTNPFDHLV